MTFEKALKYFKDGKSLTRKSWNLPIKISINGYKTSVAKFVFTDSKNNIQKYHMLARDILADDWILV